jgi:hypothetical protein
MLRMDAPVVLVERFGMFAGVFIQKLRFGHQPKTDRNRCDAFFAAAVISKLTGQPVERIQFVPRDFFGDSLLCKPDIMEYVRELNESRLFEMIGERQYTRLERLADTTAKNFILGKKSPSMMLIHFLAASAVANDRELFDALGSLVVALNEMIPRCQDPQDPSTWYVSAG